MRSHRFGFGLATGWLVLAVLVAGADFATAQGKGPDKARGHDKASKHVDRHPAKHAGKPHDKGKARLVTPGPKGVKAPAGKAPAARGRGVVAPRGPRVKGPAGAPARVGRPQGRPGVAGHAEKTGAGGTHGLKAKAIKQARFAKEQRKHLKHMARIQRIEGLAKTHGKAKLREKAGSLRAKELRRHRKTMAKLRGVTAPRLRPGASTGKALPGRMPHMKPGKPLRLRPGAPKVAPPIPKPAPARPATP